jgi:DNA-binding MarR family transcriptional regulator
MGALRRAWKVLCNYAATVGGIIAAARAGWHDHRSMSQKRGVDAPRVTAIITRLEQNGLVEQRHDREDRRVVKVFFTDEGRDISLTLVSSVTRFDQSITRGFSEGELEHFLAELQQLIVNAAEIGPGLRDRFGLLPREEV